jgi:hypothetical protein
MLTRHSLSSLHKKYNLYRSVSRLGFEGDIVLLSPMAFSPLAWRSLRIELILTVQRVAFRNHTSRESVV